MSAVLRPLRNGGNDQPRRAECRPWRFWCDIARFWCDIARFWCDIARFWCDIARFWCDIAPGVTFFGATLRPADAISENA
jgi:hypothetical protein